MMTLPTSSAQPGCHKTDGMKTAAYIQIKWLQIVATVHRARHDLNNRGEYNILGHTRQVHSGDQPMHPLH